ncbi:MAG: alpha/beta fold hydrolase [Brooklawnia sp.]|jgi:esterase
MELHGTQIGHGPEPMVFLHGLFGQGKNFANVAKLLEDRVTCTLLDLPNHGKSPWNDSFDHDTIAAIVADELVRRGAAEKPVTLMGHSWGGKVAMRLTLQHPELVRRLVVEDIAPILQDDSELQEFHDIVAALRSTDLTRVQLRADADALLQDSIGSPLTRSYLLSNLQRTPEGGWRWQLNLDLLATNMAQIGQWQGLAEDQHWDGPVLWLAGERSWYAAPAHNEAMSSYFPKVRREVIADAGHWVHWQQPQEVADTLSHFITVT